MTRRIVEDTSTSQNPEMGMQTGQKCILAAIMVYLSFIYDGKDPIIEIDNNDENIL